MRVQLSKGNALADTQRKMPEEKDWKWLVLLAVITFEVILLCAAFVNWVVR